SREEIDQAIEDFENGRFIRAH
ncbi:hypothetical protein, partial [Pseudomonas aeruginosa]